MLAQQRKFGIYDKSKASTISNRLTAEVNNFGLAPSRQLRVRDPRRDARDDFRPRAGTSMAGHEPSLPGSDLAHCQSNGSGSASLGGVWADRAPKPPLMGDVASARGRQLRSHRLRLGANFGASLVGFGADIYGLLQGPHAIHKATY